MDVFFMFVEYAVCGNTFKTVVGDGRGTSHCSTNTFDIGSVAVACCGYKTWELETKALAIN